MIEVLKNPKTAIYFEIKEIILSSNFNWYYNPSSTTSSKKISGHIDMPFYSHTLLRRPETERYSFKSSPHLDKVIEVFDEILEYNGISKNDYYYIRSCVNCVHSSPGIQLSTPHIDHKFPHYNLIIYLTDVGGKTYVEEEFHDPKEDDVIIFSGKHYMERPKEKRRIILISTLSKTNCE